MGEAGAFLGVLHHRVNCDGHHPAYHVAAVPHIVAGAQKHGRERRLSGLSTPKSRSLNVWPVRARARTPDSSSAMTLSMHTKGSPSSARLSNRLRSSSSSKTCDQRAAGWPVPTRAIVSANRVLPLPRVVAVMPNRGTHPWKVWRQTRESTAARHPARWHGCSKGKSWTTANSDAGRSERQSCRGWLVPPGTWCRWPRRTTRCWGHSLGY